MSSVQLAQPAQPASQPLSALLREKVERDAEFARLYRELREWLLRNVGAFDVDRRAHALRRLKALAPGVPRLISPAGFTVEKVAAAYADLHVSHCHANDAWASTWVRRGLEQVGADGEKALKRLDAASRAPSVGLKALGAASDELRGSLGNLAGSAVRAGHRLRRGLPLDPADRRKLTAIYQERRHLAAMLWQVYR